MGNTEEVRQAQNSQVEIKPSHEKALEEEQVEKMIERIYNINVRRKAVKTAKHNRAKKTVKLVRAYVAKHMKSNEVKLDKELNEEIWKRGAKNPLMKLKVKVIKDDEGKVKVSLVK